MYGGALSGAWKLRSGAFGRAGISAECGLCGTAAVISPVGKVVDYGREICFPSGMGRDGTGHEETVV